MADTFPLNVEALVKVFNHLNLGVYVTDLNRRILLWNRKAEEITGYRAADIVGTACHDNILNHVDKYGHPLCTTSMCPLYRAMQLGKETREPVLVYARKANGNRVAVTVSVAPLRDDSGKIIGGIECFRDETGHIRDLELAGKIQQYLMPKSMPEAENIHFDVRYYPYELVGGDFYDVSFLGGDHYGVLVADVRGHGVSAALYTMWLKSLGENLAPQATNPAEFIMALNRELSRVLIEEGFATAIYAVVDADQSKAIYCNAGHPPPLHFHASKKEVSELECHCTPLGVVPDSRCGQSTVQLAPGDVLLFYTDGVTDIVGTQGNRLSSTGLARLLTEEVARRKPNLLDRLYQRTLQICGEVSLQDDVLLLSLSRK